MPAQIIGGDVIEVNYPKDAEFGARRFMQALRSRPNYKHAYVVGMVENQGDNNYPQFWHDWWSEYPPFISVKNYNHPLQLPGVPTGEKEKDRYDDRLNQLLATGGIAFEDHFITGMAGTTRENEHASHVKGVLRNQLREYCIITKKSEQKGIQTFTKTRSGKHSGGQDDMAMALQIALYHSKRAMKEDQPVRELELRGYPFRWSIDEEREQRSRQKELDANIPLPVLLSMPVKEQASAAEQRNSAKRRKVAEVVQAAQASASPVSPPSAASAASPASQSPASHAPSVSSSLPLSMFGSGGDF